MNVDPSYPPSTHCTSRALSPPAARPAAHDPPLAAKRGRRSTPSALPLNPTITPQTPKRDVSPHAPQLSPLCRPNVSLCPPNVALCRPNVDPCTPPQHPVTSSRPNILSRRRKKLPKTEDIGRHWTTSIPFRYPALSLLRRRPRRQPSAPQPPNSKTSPPGACGLPGPKPAAPNTRARTQPPWHRPLRFGTAISYV